MKRPDIGQLWLFLALLSLVACHTENNTIKSPSSALTASFGIDSTGRLAYTIRLNDHEVIGSSPLGIELDHVDLGEDAEITGSTRSSFNENYAMMGIHDTATNNYNQAIFSIKKNSTSYQLQVRAFNEGIAYRYIVPGKDSLVVTSEASAWKIPDGSTVWYQDNIYYYEGLHYSSRISALGKKRLGPPVTYRTPEGIYASITEAALYNYSGMSLRSDSTGILYADFINDPNGWKILDTVVSPWRVVLAASNLNELVNADVINNLNPAPDSSFAKSDWIKPGRGVWTYFMHDNVTTVELEKSYVDKAVKLGFEYNIVDAGWEESWPDKWNTLRELADYSRKKGIGTWVWKGYAALRTDSARRSFFKSLNDAGVAGVKIDFIDKEGIEQILFYEHALRDAAASHLMINFHGADKPTGYSRRFPNEMTREAIYGQEWRTYTPQGAINNVTMPFTRFLAGPADCTPCVFNSSKAYGTSWAHQLALPIIFYSPVSCWPEDPDVYLASPASSIVRSMPAIWDQTIVLPQSELGKRAAFARRKGNDWFVGIINGDDEASFVLPLTFAGPGKNYEAELFKDDLSTADNMLRSKTGFTNADSLYITMRPKGGFVVRLTRTNEPLTKLSILPEEGYLRKPTTVSLSSNDPQSEIRYTTDATEPSAKSLLYTQPFIVKDSMTVRSRTFKNGQPGRAIAVSQFLPAPAPIINPEGGIFIDSQKITLAGPPGAKIYYTVDGSAPTISSEYYQRPIDLNHSATIKAKIFFDDDFGSGIAAKTFRKAVPNPATHEAQSVATKNASGLHFNYYEGAWTMMPVFKTLTIKRSGIVPYPGLEGITAKENNYGIEFYGLIDIPSTGVYSFYTISDDGSQLFVDGEKLVDNDGTHGDLEKTGAVALAKGKHLFRVLYFQSTSGISLRTYIKGPGIEKQEIPAALFSH